MKYYAGLDVSLEESAVCVMDEQGTVVEEARVESEPEALAAFFRRLGLVPERIGLEACSLSAFLHEALRAAGMPALCIETRHAKGVMKTMPVKTDRKDARALAQMMRTGWFRVVHVKSADCRALRALLVARRQVLNKARDMENGVRAVLREAGLKMGKVGRQGFAARARDLAVGNVALEVVVGPLLSIIETMRREFDRLTKRAFATVRDDPVCRHLMTAQGVGPLTALAFRATIDDPARFTRSRDVGVYVGLTPKRYQSGETDVSGAVSRCGDELLRTALYEAAHTLMTRAQKYSALKSWGMAVAKRRGLRRACVAVARKLAVILHAMWRDATAFRWGKEAPAAA
jgi:transposase